jgi:hypothetical protein
MKLLESAHEGTSASGCRSFDCLGSVAITAAVWLPSAACTGLVAVRGMFCQWFLQWCGANPNFTASVMCICG